MPVSYTHLLDNMSDIAAPADIERLREYASWLNYETVSYTHLDVYKRQSLSRRTLL